MNTLCLGAWVGTGHGCLEPVKRHQTLLGIIRERGPLTRGMIVAWAAYELDSEYYSVRSNLSAMVQLGQVTVTEGQWEPFYAAALPLKANLHG